MDVSISRRTLVAVSNEVKIRCWRALRDAGMTFSSDVTTSVEVHDVPVLAFEPQRETDRA